MRQAASVSPRASPHQLLFALVLATLALSFYRIFVSTVGLSRASRHAESEDAYGFEFAPRVARATAGGADRPGARRPPTLGALRTFDEARLPYPCGVVFFYHIACTGGASMNKWLGKEKDHNANVTYWTHWGRHDGIQDKFIAGMNEQVQDLGPHDWRIVHVHGHSLFPDTSEAHLYRWREEVERQGCAFVATTMLRDAVGHTISQTKGMINPNLTLDEFLYHLEPENYDVRGHFNTQIDYMVYNRGPRNSRNVTKEEKVRRAMELLARHFDVVLLSDHERFTEIMLKITGWVPTKMPHGNTFKGSLEYTERELRKIIDLTEANGDVLFIDAVRHVYYGHLDYLLA